MGAVISEASSSQETVSTIEYGAEERALYPALEGQVPIYDRNRFAIPVNIGYILDRFVEAAREAFGTDLTGVYLHGSLAMGCFREDKSDIDLIVVVEGDISDGQKMRFMEEVTALNPLAPKKGIEMSVVKKTYCREFVHPAPYELHYSPAHLDWFRRAPQEYIQKMKGTDKDLAAHFTIIYHHGIVLSGAKIEEIFAPVPREDYLDSILFDVENAKEEIMEQPMYIVLNLCRVLAYMREGLVLSKLQGGEWGLKHLEAVYRRIVGDAVRCYTSDKEMVVERQEAERFCDMMRDCLADGGQLAQEAPAGKAIKSEGRL